MDITEIATGLKFPEGPVAMDDGSVILVEIARGTLSRVKPGGKVQVVAKLGGGPNGAAVGPDGAMYVTNNGGFEWRKRGGMLLPGHKPADYTSGSIQRVDLSSGKVDVLYTACEGRPLCGPNDLVFDKDGGFYFTDLGKSEPGKRDLGAFYYAKADGSKIVRLFDGLLTPNGCGLSPDGKTVYYAGTMDSRLWAADVLKPGKLAPHEGFTPARCLGQSPTLAYFDSMAVQADGSICVATILNSGITTFSPDGKKVKHTPMPDLFTTNICFGGKGMKTAYITLSGTGTLVSVPWPKAGLRLNFNA